MAGAITDVGGVLLGHAHDARRGSGVTVLLFPGGARAAADIRGGAAGTRQLDSVLRPHPADRIHALVLAGGSAFGLDAASGVVRFLEERGIGFRTPGGVVPIVPAAVVYDLNFGDPSFRPTAEMGLAAARSASTRRPAQGSVGAGAGATVGKVFGVRRAMKGGFGTAREASKGAAVGACAVVNAFGDVVDPKDGRVVAGARGARTGRPVGTEALFRAGARRTPFAPESTTLGVVATADDLSRDELAAFARMAHGALFRAIRPVHTPMDGDIVFAVSTGASGRRGNLMQTAVLGQAALERAILSAVKRARGTREVPAAAEIGKREGRT